jgi:hypothetical protein
VTGFYEIDLVWTSTAGQSHTAVNLYTGSATGGPADIWGNPNGPAGVISSGTVYEWYSNARSWWPFTFAQLSSGTTYHVGIYGGYQTPYAGGATQADTQANRVTIGGFRFMAATPDAATYELANHATGLGTASGDRVTGVALTWAPGQYNSLYNVWLGTLADSLTEIGAGLGATTLDLDNQDLQGSTQYFYRVDPVNVDVTTTGTVFDFTTVAVPEPSTALLGLLGGLGIMVWFSRRCTA